MRAVSTVTCVRAWYTICYIQYVRHELSGAFLNSRHLPAFPRLRLCCRGRPREDRLIRASLRASLRPALQPRARPRCCVWAAAPKQLPCTLPALLPCTERRVGWRKGGPDCARAARSRAESLPSRCGVPPITTARAPGRSGGALLSVCSAVWLSATRRLTSSSSQASNAFFNVKEVESLQAILAGSPSSVLVLLGPPSCGKSGALARLAGGAGS